MVIWWFYDGYTMFIPLLFTIMIYYYVILSLYYYVMLLICYTIMLYYYALLSCYTIVLYDGFHPPFPPSSLLYALDEELLADHGWLYDFRLLLPGSVLGKLRIFWEKWQNFQLKNHFTPFWFGKMEDNGRSIWKNMEDNGRMTWKRAAFHMILTPETGDIWWLLHGRMRNWRLCPTTNKWIYPAEIATIKFGFMSGKLWFTIQNLDLTWFHRWYGILTADGNRILM